LFATDFSAVSNNAASYARALARRFSSSVEIAHVFDPASVRSYEEPIVSRTEEERRRLVEDQLEHLREDFAALGINTRTISREGHRASVSLLKIVTEQRIDLIVAGTHSKSGMERRVLGSTAEQLIRSAACPVFTVGPHAKQPPPLFFEHIVYATDFLLEAAKAAV
jgi:nucleotide-binding universal stress UspA family protein